MVNPPQPEADRQRRERLKRVHRRSVVFNAEEYKLMEAFCRRYGVKNRSKLFREAILGAMLRQMEQDHPKLF